MTAPAAISPALDEHSPGYEGWRVATASALGRYSFYQVNLLTGRATRVGSFRPAAQVADIAIPLDQG